MRTNDSAGPGDCDSKGSTLSEAGGGWIGELEPLGRFSATKGHSDERCDACLARDAERLAAPRHEPGEQLRAD